MGTCSLLMLYKRRTEEIPVSGPFLCESGLFHRKLHPGEDSDKLTFKTISDGCGGFALDMRYISCPCRVKSCQQMQPLLNLFRRLWRSTLLFRGLTLDMCTIVMKQGCIFFSSPKRSLLPHLKNQLQV